MCLNAWSARRSSSTVSKRRTPQEVLLQHPDEALGAAVALGLADEGRRAFQAKEADLALEMVADILRPMIVTERKAMSDVLGEGAEALTYGLPDGLERLEAIGTAAGVNADALRRAMIDRDEHRRLALAGHH